MVTLVRRWLPQVPIQVLGDNAYSVIDLGTVCQNGAVALIAPLHLDARLCAPPPTTKAATGRPRVVGKRLPNLSAVLVDAHTTWHNVAIPWYAGTCKTLELATGTGLWYSTGFQPLPLRWVLVRNPHGKVARRALFTTDQAQSAASVVTDFVTRWSLEVTFEESRAHLGLETQRQWRTKPLSAVHPSC
jgi:hypothetical protein